MCRTVSSSPTIILSQSVSFCRLSPRSVPWVGWWQGQAAFRRDDSFCDRLCKGGAPTGGAVYNVIPQQLLRSQP